MVNSLLEAMTNVYLSLLHLGLKARLPLLIVSFIVLAITARTVLPLVGRELMPRMDTGMIIIKADLPPSMTIDEVEASIGKIEQVINSNLTCSAFPQLLAQNLEQVSFGAGGN